MSRFQRLALQIQQIKSILQDFSKVRKKCVHLFSVMEEEFPKEKVYEELQRQIHLKINILDHPGLVTLKNRLVEALTQILELEHQLNYQIERKKAKREYISDQNIKSQKEISHIKTDKKKNTDSQLPLYVIRNDTVQNKLDSIGKYLATLKKSMKMQSQNADHLKIDQFLISEPQYMQLKEKLENYQMRQEELQIIIEKKVKQEVNKYLANCEVIEENQFYRTFRVYKNQQPQRQKPVSKISENVLGIKERQQHQNNKAQDQLGIIAKQLNLQAKVDLQAIRKQVNEDFEDIRKSIEQKPDSLSNLFDKISETVSVSEGKLKQLRGKRKRMFIDDDIWDQMGKM